MMVNFLEKALREVGISYNLYYNGRLEITSQITIRKDFYNLLIITKGNNLITRGPMYVSAQRFPVGQDIGKEWERELRFLLNCIKEEQSVIVKYVCLDHLIESSSTLLLILNRLIVEHNRRLYEQFQTALYTLAHSSEAMFNFLEDGTIPKRIIRRISNLIDKLFSQKLHLEEYYKKEGTKVRRFWRPREAQNEIHNYYFSKQVLNAVSKKELMIDIVTPVFYGSVSILGHVLAGLRKLNESALPAIMVYSKNEKVLNRKEEINNEKIRIYKHIIEIWGSLKYRPILLVDDSIGSGRTIRYALILLLSITRDENLDELLQKYKQSYKDIKELVNYAKTKDIYVAIEAKVPEETISEQKRNEYKNLLQSLLVEPPFLVMPSKVIIIYPKQLYKQVGLVAKSIRGLAEFDVELKDKEKFLNFRKKYEELINTA